MLDLTMNGLSSCYEFTYRY